MNKKQRITLFLDPALVKKAKGQALQEETTLTGLVEKALDKYLPVVVKVTFVDNTKVK
ncbi:CopG family transcriptional regulator [Candidatus Daviesbacteria bacterium]|nr:CopG family transcriptional regulator [Candidatus Daviesbacteria bacterium]